MENNSEFFAAADGRTPFSYVVWLWVSLFPLHEDELGDDKRDNEDQHHLRVHGLVAFVFGMHLGVLHPVGQTHKTQRKRKLVQ